MLSFRRRFTHHLPETTDFVMAQTPPSLFAGNLSNTLGGISRNDTEASGVTEQATQGSNCSTCDAGTAGRLSTTTLPAASRFAGYDIGLHALDITQGKTRHSARPQQRLDVGLNPAPIHLER